VRNGAYQIFQWGWIADYPDPEHFLFLLWSEMARSKNEGPNTANFSNPAFDDLFLAMKTRANDETRMDIIRRMRSILETERPWIELFHPEDYALFHGWLRNVKPAGMSYPTAKYRSIDTELREARRASWNDPVVWPAYALLGAGIALVIPGVVTFFRERQ
jgi:ABC-type oligopeptide transport system substrate-binding subunit